LGVTSGQLLFSFCTSSVFLLNVFVTQMGVTKYRRNADSLQYYGLLYDSHLLGQNRRHLDEPQ